MSVSLGLMVPLRDNPWKEGAVPDRKGDMEGMSTGTCRWNRTAGVNSATHVHDPDTHDLTSHDLDTA
jgi:hypothetical protein